ncbi:hypothetical protein D3C85_1704980 [compost metagenome]
MAFVMWISLQGSKPLQPSMVIFSVIMTLLYPYSRFVYERIVGFIMGDNVFFVNAFFMLFAKAFTMLICWTCAIFIAPVGLAYLYFYHRKAAGEG